jgi:menaquinone-dependent protoporphyrinogen IX oxidase
MKGIIVYKGKYGATRQYAQWIAQTLELSIVTPENFSARQFTGNDFIILGCSVYIGELQLRDWLQQNAELLKTKKLFLFVVCATPASEKEKLDAMVQRNVPASLRQNMEVFFFHGRLIRSRLSWKDRMLLKIGSMLAKTSSEKETMTKDFDDVNRQYITGLVSTVKKLYTGASAVHYV